MFDPFRVFLFSFLRTPGCVVSFNQERPGSSPGRFWRRRPAFTRLPRLPSSVCPVSVIERPTDLRDEKKKTLLVAEKLRVLTRMKPLSTVAPVTCIVVTRVKLVVRMRVGSGQIVGFHLVGLCFLPFYFGNKTFGKKKL